MDCLDCPNWVACQVMRDEAAKPAEGCALGLDRGTCEATRRGTPHEGQQQHCPSAAVCRLLQERRETQDLDAAEYYAWVRRRWVEERV